MSKKEITIENHAQFHNSNNLTEILTSFGVKRDGRVSMKKEEFLFEVEHSIEGDWHLIATRDLKKVANWRRESPHSGIYPAVGLGISFQKQVGCIVTPPHSV